MRTEGNGARDRMSTEKRGSSTIHAAWTEAASTEAARSNPGAEFKIEAGKDLNASERAPVFILTATAPTCGWKAPAHSIRLGQSFQVLSG
jgi:hypothetical protein